jgi:uncharacterized protein with GYD domain
MGRYLIQAAYTPGAWAAMVEHPQDRSKPVQAMVERLGGRLECFYVSFGEYDVVSIVELPDDVAAAAASIAASAGGALKAIKTTVLLGGAEALDAAARARRAGYEPPHAGPATVTPIPAG